MSDVILRYKKSVFTLNTLFLCGYYGLECNIGHEIGGFHILI